MRLPLPVMPLNRWLVLSHLSVLSLPLVTLLGTGALARDLQAQTQEDLEHQASLLAMLVAEHARRAPGHDLDAVAEPVTRALIEAKQATLAGFRVVNDVGTVVASSGDGVGEDISDDAEVQSALAGSAGFALRPRPTDGARSQPLSSASRRAPVRVFVARPVRVEGEVVGAVVLSRTPREEWQTLWQMAPQLWAGAVLAILGTSAGALVIGYVMSRSIMRLADISARIASGEQGVDGLVAPAEASRLLEVRTLAMALRTLSQRLDARLAYIADFAANVSHEFKTPVASLLGVVELLHDDMPAPQKARFLDNAKADLERLSRLVGGLLRLARAERSLERDEVDLDGLVREICARAGVPVAGTAGRVWANRVELQSVLLNLLDNARQHGGREVRVTLHPRGFDVWDNGPGLSKATEARLFERFFTTAREQGGTGLGLAFVRAVIVAHGGEVRAHSGPEGTRFEVRLEK